MMKLPIHSFSVLHLGNIITEEEVILQTKTRGLLPCLTESEFFAVGWIKDNNVLIRYEQTKGKWQKSGQGYTDGLFDIGENCSLIINNVTIKDGGQYIVQMGEKNTGKLFNSQTNVLVYGK